VHPVAVNLERGSFLPVDAALGEGSLAVVSEAVVGTGCSLELIDLATWRASSVMAAGPASSWKLTAAPTSIPPPRRRSSMLSAGPTERAIRNSPEKSTRGDDSVYGGLHEPTPAPRAKRSN